MKLYWVSATVQNKDDREPWLCAMYDGEVSMNSAMRTINRLKENYNVLSAWIDVTDGNGMKETVYREEF